MRLRNCIPVYVESNLVPPSSGSFDPSKHLCRNDLFNNEVGILVRLKWSKTNQCHDRRVSIPLLRKQGSPLCPLAAFSQMIKLAPAAPDRPAFLFVSNRSLVSFTHASFVSKLKATLSSIGFPAEQFSGHSFRRGGATWAFKKGVPGELIMSHGDWRSGAYLEYLDRDIGTRCSLACWICKLFFSL